jgi:NADH-ubiquinone oxidoreductase chain 1
MLIFSWALNALLVILTVAFFTLFERKIIGLIHLRVGPNKVSFLGLLQPLVDAIKLLRKQHLTSIQSNKIVYVLTPISSLVVSLLFWLLLPQPFFTFSISYSILAYLVLGSILVLLALLSGWSSNSKYTFIGRLRSIAQSVSYEAIFTTLVILSCILSQSYRILSIRRSFSLILFFTLIPLWGFSLLAETHRAPFDFSESESELVSGYNTEYGRANFAW